MKCSESIAKLAAALAEAQKELKNPPLDSTNPHFNSKFASLKGTRGAVQPVLAAHGISVIQMPIGDGPAVGLETMLLHESGEYISETMMINWSTDNPQKIASLITYLRRYAMQGFANVVGDIDDDGNDAESTVKVPRGAFAALSTDMQTYVQDLATEIGTMCTKGKSKEAADRLETEEMDEIVKTAFWSLLTAPHRAAIKKELEGRKK